jgi:hypothetical protein
MTASYRIECVVRPDSPSEHRRHITAIGTVEPDGTKKRWTDMAAVRAAMANGDSFFTKNHEGEETAPVEPYDCGCGAETIRSGTARVADNNLDNMVACPVARASRSS